MAVKDIEIQSGINAYVQQSLVRASNETLFAVYNKVADSDIYIAYSTDAGTTWTESASKITGSYSYPVIAIDSSDNVLVAYRDSTDAILYRQFTVAGGWSAEETISSDTTNSSSDIAMAVDSADNVHVTWAQVPVADNHEAIYYNKRTAGTWASRTLIYQEPSGVGSNNQRRPCIVIDSNNYIYIIWSGLISGTGNISYVRYTSSWSARVQIGTTNVIDSSLPRAVIDSEDNVHVIWYTVSGTNAVYYNKYTFATTLWSGASIIISNSSIQQATIAIDTSDNLYVVAEAGGIILLTYNGSWDVGTQLLTDGSGGHTVLTTTMMQSTRYPIAGGFHTNIASAGYHFTFIDTVAGVNILRYYASTNLDFPASQTKNYSRGDEDALPSTDQVVETPFTEDEYDDVATDDSIYADQSATNDYSIFVFKNYVPTGITQIDVEWIGKTNLAGSTSSILLQIYNHNTDLWETLDTNSTVAINTKFTLAGIVSASVSNYINNNWVTCRVYQLAQ